MKRACNALKDDYTKVMLQQRGNIMRNRMKRREFFEKYKHGIPLIIFAIIYLVWFYLIENHLKGPYTIIHTPLDDKIPFCEIFVIPYLLWFVYMAVVVVYLFFKDKEEYFKCCSFLFIGMTVFLIISTVSPNGQFLRPVFMERDNIFTDMVRNLYRTDTPTNLWPSIHVFNSIGCHIAVSKSEKLRSNKLILRGSFVLCVLIILSTMFIKQHSVFDVFTAFLMAMVLYHVVYLQERVIVKRVLEPKF